MCPDHDGKGRHGRGAQSQGGAFFVNDTISQAAAVQVPAPAPGVVVNGGQAFWKVEQAQPLPPEFLPVVFRQCVAGTQHHSFDLTAPSAGSSIITNPAGATLATSFIAPPNTNLVLWEANQ